VYSFSVPVTISAALGADVFVVSIPGYVSTPSSIVMTAATSFIKCFESYLVGISLRQSNLCFNAVFLDSQTLETRVPWKEFLKAS
jgi:hypothetical protein